MREISFIQTNVFTEDRFRFSGNQLATFLTQKTAISADEMHQIAIEMNFSESTFIFDSQNATCNAKVRIFTIESEVPFAGHPTLGSAFVLKQQNIIPAQSKEAWLELGIGPIKVQFIDQETIGMVQPPPKFLDKLPLQDNLAEALELQPQDIDKRYPIQCVSTGYPFLLIPITSLAALQKASLNSKKLLAVLHNFPAQDVVLFSWETLYPENSAHVRMFAPGAGVAEDPATGSAAGPLCAYIEQYKVLSNHRKGTPLIIEQGYEIHRPSRLNAQTITANSSITGIYVYGKVKLAAVGTYYL